MPRYRSTHRTDQADTEGADRHDDNGDREHLLATELVTHGAKEQTAERTHQEGHGEGCQRGDHLYAGRGAGEEDLAKCVGDKAVYAEVEPLHRVAQAAAVIAFLSLLSSMMVMSLMCIGLCRFFLTSYNHPLMNYSLFVKA